MKKIVTLIAAFTMLISAVSCGNNEKSEKKHSKDDSSVSESVSEKDNEKDDSKKKDKDSEDDSNDSKKSSKNKDKKTGKESESKSDSEDDDTSTQKDKEESSEADDSDDSNDNDSDSSDSLSEVFEGLDILESIDKMKVEKQGDNVQFTFPSEFLGNEDPQELVEEAENEEGVVSAKVNDDNSIDLVITKEAHAEIMNEMNNIFEESIESITSECKTVTNVSHSDDYSEIVVTVTNKEDFLNSADSYISYSFEYIAGYYMFFAGECENISSAECTVKYLDADGNSFNVDNNFDMSMFG